LLLHVGSGLWRLPWNTFSTQRRGAERFLQKETKAGNHLYGFVAFVCFCGSSQSGVKPPQSKSVFIRGENPEMTGWACAVKHKAFSEEKEWQNIRG
jgi:hypothetical protein